MDYIGWMMGGQACRTCFMIVGMEVGRDHKACEVTVTVVDFIRSELGGWECDIEVAMSHPKAGQVVVVTSIQMEGVCHV